MEREGNDERNRRASREPGVHRLGAAPAAAGTRLVESDATPRPEAGLADVGARERERALVLAAQRGARDAFAQLVRLHQPRAFAVARAITLTREDAEDAVQEAFLHAYRALERFRPDQPFGAWIARIAANAALDIGRRRKVRDADQLPESLATPFRDPAEADELRARLRDGLARLTARQRAVIVLHDVEGFTAAEISGMRGIPEGRARSDLHRARVALRRLLGDLRSDGDG